MALAEGLADGPSIHKQWVDSRRKDRDFSERIVGFYGIFSYVFIEYNGNMLVYPSIPSANDNQSLLRKINVAVLRANS